MRIYADNFPQEKVYIQFDKNIYTAGESIWFKAYLFSGTDPSLISTSFYAELSDAKGNIVQRKSAPVIESSAASSFDIPADFKEDHYHFRAYTSWMMNFDTTFLYEKDIRIISKTVDSPGSAPPQEQYLQFFAEGGDMVAGLENSIAFKSTDQYGMPVPIKGVIKDGAGKEVLEFISIHDGMGKFFLIPDSKDVFTAEWNDAKGAAHKMDLPAVKPEGITLRVLNADKKVIFAIAKASSESHAYDHLSVIAYMNQQLVYKAMVNLQESPMSGGSIPTYQLPSGILQITIFNNHDQPLAERIAFVNNHEYDFPANITVQTKSTAKRGINSFDIEVPDSLRSNLSVAVTDFEADGRKKDEDNIFSRLLLTADIKGMVYKPFYYFSNTSDSTRNHLDLVMMTHGWRRFKWEQLFAGRKPVIKYPRQEYLAINAEVFGIDPTRLSSKEGINIILKKKDSSVQMIEVPRFKAGKFLIDGLIFYDTAKAFYQFNVNRNLPHESAIVFKNGLYSGFKQSKALVTSYNGWTADDSLFLKKNRFILDEAIRIKPDLDKRVQILATVTVKGRQKSPAQKLDEQYTSGLFSGGDAYSFDILNDPTAIAYPDVFAYLSGKVGGLQITTDATGQPLLLWRGTPTTIFLDEMKVASSEIKNLVSVPQIALVKVFRPGAMMNLGGGAGGTIAIYTRKGVDRVYDPSIHGLEQFRIVGYSAIKQFYSPDYLRQTEINDIEDIRTTLYWKPFIFLDKSNRQTAKVRIMEGR